MDDQEDRVPASMTPEERAAEVRKAFTSEPESEWTFMLEDSVAAAIRAAILEEREACAKATEAVIECCECVEGNHGRGARAIRARA